jgi:hypothetical protein
MKSRNTRHGGVGGSGGDDLDTENTAGDARGLTTILAQVLVAKTTTFLKF